MSENKTVMFPAGSSRSLIATRSRFARANVNHPAVSEVVRGPERNPGRLARLRDRGPKRVSARGGVAADGEAGVDQPGLDAVGYMGGTGLEPVSPSVSKAGQRSAPVRHTHVLVDEAELTTRGCSRETSAPGVLTSL